MTVDTKILRPAHTSPVTSLRHLPLCYVCQLSPSPHRVIVTSPVPLTDKNAMTWDSMTHFRLHDLCQLQKGHVGRLENLAEGGVVDISMQPLVSDLTHNDVGPETQVVSV